MEIKIEIAEAEYMYVGSDPPQMDLYMMFWAKCRRKHNLH